LKAESAISLPEKSRQKRESVEYKSSVLSGLNPALFLIFDYHPGYIALLKAVVI
jgi:hypothetical protein